METIEQFRERVSAALTDIGSGALSYDESEFWMYRSPYEYIDFYATEKRLFNTAIALQLSRGLHDGTHRKSSIMKDGVVCRLPYVIHPLLVCRMLLDMQVPLSKDEEDILLAAALCHDMIEDIPFPLHGTELYTNYYLDKRVYDTVKKVSKRKDFTPEEELGFFHVMEQDRLAVLVKLSDRGNNVEDLYNMSVSKVHEYAGETIRLFLPMCAYAFEHYPELSESIAILHDKIVSLTDLSVILVDRYDRRERELKVNVERLRCENAELRMLRSSVLLGNVSGSTPIPSGDDIIPIPEEDSNSGKGEQSEHCEKDRPGCAEMFHQIESYAVSKNLSNTVLALPLLRAIIEEQAYPRCNVSGNRVQRHEYYRHALSVCWILIKLQLPLEREDEDVILSSALVHVIPELARFENGGEELVERFGLGRGVFDTVRLITSRDATGIAGQSAYFARIQENRSALLVKLADRGSLVEQLYSVSASEAREYINETKRYYLPMCVYGKEHYKEVYPEISVLMEKIRSLAAVTDILAARYQEREASLADEMFSLMEENSWIRDTVNAVLTASQENARGQSRNNWPT